MQSNNKNRFRRGLLTHSLLQYLPNITMDKREAVGKNYQKKQASELSEAIRVSILNEVLAILTHPDFAPYFGEGSLAEVPLTGKVTNTQGKIEIISGQIDRMLVTDNSIWIVDFKSNRPPPKNIKDIPTQYRNQLKAYKTLIKDIYPNHTIHCALLWTDGPFMSELKDL
jgi:ATP-dependent helicase/nuclease subunit A